MILNILLVTDCYRCFWSTLTCEGTSWWELLFPCIVNSDCRKYILIDGTQTLYKYRDGEKQGDIHDGVPALPYSTGVPWFHRGCQHVCETGWVLVGMDHGCFLRTCFRPTSSLFTHHLTDYMIGPSASWTGHFPLNRTFPDYPLDMDQCHWARLWNLDTKSPCSDVT